MLHKVLICSLLLASSATYSQAVQKQIPPYKNPDLPIEERVEDLLGRMTIDEKIAQIRHIHSSDIFNGQEFDPQKLSNKAGDIAWGFVEGFPLTGDTCARYMSTWSRRPVWVFPSSP